MPFEKCSQEGCDKLPCMKVYWPSKVPPPIYCVDHAQKAKALLAHMGTPVVIEAYQPKLIEPRTVVDSLD
jgi:hypothetical protein